ncbi:MAG: hypothetical protein NTZ68_02785 [Candidatus Dependentiae bacterium]|nr:hypothetical protein [Candidatus Dependentiae bacterium]
MKKIILITSLFLGINLSASEKDFSTPTARQAGQFPTHNPQGLTSNVHTLSGAASTAPGYLPTDNSNVRTLHTTSDTRAFSGAGNTIMGSILATPAYQLTNQAMGYLQRAAHNLPEGSNERLNIISHHNDATLAHARAEAKNPANRPAFDASALPFPKLS